MKAPQAILGTFAAIWGVVGLAFIDAPKWMLALPILLSLALAVPAWRVATRLAPLPPERREMIRRVVRKWSRIEGVVIMAAIAGLAHIHRQDLIAAALALVVGVHFIPLARQLPERTYWATGAALALLGLAGLILPQTADPGAIGLAGATVLWLTMLARPSLGNTPAG